MEKESLIANLKQRIGENDFNAISHRSVETIIEPLLPLFAEDDKITEETYALPVALLQSFIGQNRHDIAEGLKAQKAEFEAQKAKAIEEALAAAKAQAANNEPPTPKVAEPSPAEPNDINKMIDEKLASMMATLTGKEGAIGKLTDSLDTFIKNYEAQRTQETEAEIKRKISTSLEELGAESQPIIELVLEKLSISKDKDYNTLLGEAKSSYQELFKKFYSNGVQPFAGGAGGDSKDAGFESYMAKQKALADRQAEDAKALQTKMI